MKIGIGLSTDKDNIQATKEAVQRAKANLREESVELAVVFATADFAHYGTLKIINSYLGLIPLAGCTTQVIISHEGLFERGILIALFHYPFGIFCNTACVKELKGESSLAGQQLGDRLLYGSKNLRRDLAVVFSDRLTENGQYLISGIQEKLGKSFPLIGISPSSSLASLKNRIFCNTEILGNAGLGMLWGGKLSFGLGTRHGWKPIGKPRQITRFQGNIAYEIDGAPASALYENYLACDRETLKKDLRHFSTLYPLGIRMEGKEYLLRNVTSIAEDGSLALSGGIPQDSQIRLMISTKESCLDGTREALQEAKKGLMGRPCRFAFIFESVPRYKALGRDAKEELELAKDILGKDVPFCGIATAGEQAPLNLLGYHGEAYFHNQCITVLAMGG